MVRWPETAGAHLEPKGPRGSPAEVEVKQVKLLMPAVSAGFNLLDFYFMTQVVCLFCHAW